MRCSSVDSAEIKNNYKLNGAGIDMSLPSSDSHDVYTSMSTRLAYLIVIDILAVGLTLQDTNHYTRLMREINERLSNLYIE